MFHILATVSGLESRSKGPVEILILQKWYKGKPGTAQTFQRAQS